jgi:hypothetical protein
MTPDIVASVRADRIFSKPTRSARRPTPYVTNG